MTEAAQHYQSQLANTARKQGYNLATIMLPDHVDRNSAERCLIQASGARTDDRVPLPKGSVKGVLGAFVASALETLPAKHYALLVMGHGSGLLRAQGAAGLSPRSLRDELEPAVAGLGCPLDLVGLDTCFGGSLEVACELRGTCRFLTAAPGLIYSPGLAWSEALESSSSQPVDVARNVVKAGMPGEGTVALLALDLSRLPAVSSGLSALTAALRNHLVELAPTMTFVRSRTRSWGEKNELCDVRELAARLQGNTANAEVSQASAQVIAAVDDMVVARWQGAGQGGEALGLGIYYPPTVEEVPAGYAREFELAAMTGWAAYLRESWGRVSGMWIGAPSSSTE
ncbi:MAG: clostripain-related cysteine peptidase [Armatimonadia bacterium]